MIYTVGIKKKFWPGYKKYKVKSHLTETRVETYLFDAYGKPRETFMDQIRPRLVLTLVDDTKILVPNITETEWMLYPDYAHGVAESMMKHSKEAGEMAKSAVGSDRSSPVIPRPATAGA